MYDSEDLTHLGAGLLYASFGLVVFSTVAIGVLAGTVEGVNWILRRMVL